MYVCTLNKIQIIDFKKLKFKFKLEIYQVTFLGRVTII